MDESLPDELGPRLTGLRRRAREARQELAWPVERPRVLQADECAIARPSSLLWRAAGCPRDVEVDVTARRQDVLVRLEKSPEEPVPDEVTLARQSVDDVDPPGIAAVEFPQSVGETTTSELDHEVMVVQHECPREGDPAVLVRRPLVQPKEELVFGGCPEDGLPVVATRADVVAAGRIDRSRWRHRLTVGVGARLRIVCGTFVTLLSPSFDDGTGLVAPCP